MYKQNKKFNRKKSFEKSQTNPKAEKYNELNEKHNDDHQQQTWSRICELKDRSLEIIQSEEEKSGKRWEAVMLYPVKKVKQGEW